MLVHHSSYHVYQIFFLMFHLPKIMCGAFFLTQTNDPVIEAPEANFMKLVQGLIEDTDGREHFLKVSREYPTFICCSK